MVLKQRQFSREFKLGVLREIEVGKSIAQASRQHQLHPTLIGRWRQQHRQYGEKAFAGNGHAYQEEARVAELERMIGPWTIENALLNKALLRFETAPVGE
jgi:transposase